MDRGRLNSSNSQTQNNNNPNKCLWFDRRYGLVYDVWKDPQEEALSGARGMFCILPLTQTFINSASHAINLTATSALQLLEKPDLFTPEALKLKLNGLVQRITSCMKKPQFDLPILRRSPTFSSTPHGERNELHNA
ncbi:uncharacterized protein [Coffea arabica]|uniref:Uncharacterized protein isoform X1 n=1 Tax=Coffea arabica TaxID=13443 RepID=A0A6P6UK04_COFAR|nr:uncharacterized protein LOC113711828 isoform X1 [Coffea arabica]